MKGSAAEKKEHREKKIPAGSIIRGAVDSVLSKYGKITHHNYERAVSRIYKSLRRAGVFSKDVVWERNKEGR